MKEFKIKKKIDIKKRFIELAESLNLEDSGEDYSTFENKNGDAIKLDRDNLVEIARNLFNKNNNV